MGLRPWGVGGGCELPVPPSLCRVWRAKKKGSGVVEMHGKGRRERRILGGEQTGLELRGRALTLARRILQCRVQEAWS